MAYGCGGLRFFTSIESCCSAQTDGMFLIEVDRLLKPGGYFVLTSPATKPHGSSLTMKKRTMLKPMQEFAEKICWTLMAQQDETFIWQKTVDSLCHLSR